MYSRIREQFSTTALILSLIALVLAVAGGAYAAKQAGLNGKQKKEVTKIAKGFQGTGPAGAPGTKGDPGAPGATGAAGAAGPTGPAGAGVVVTKVDTGKIQCDSRGGAIAAVEGKPGVEICNGEEGPQGEPWTLGGVLPEGETETGAWAFTASDADSQILAPISFPLPLDVGIFEEAKLHFQPTNETSASCPSENANKPEALPGHLCVYYSPGGGSPVNATFNQIYPLSFLEEPGTSTSGAILKFTFSGGAGETAQGFGSWALTAPEGP